MVSRKYYLRIVIRVLFLAANALAIGWLLLGGQVQFIGFFLLLIFFIQVSEMRNNFV